MANKLSLGFAAFVALSACSSSRGEECTSGAALTAPGPVQTTFDGWREAVAGFDAPAVYTLYYAHGATPWLDIQVAADDGGGCGVEPNTLGWILHVGVPSTARGIYAVTGATEPEAPYVSLEHRAPATFGPKDPQNFDSTDYRALGGEIEVYQDSSADSQNAGAPRLFRVRAEFAQKPMFSRGCDVVTGSGKTEAFCQCAHEDGRSFSCTTTDPKGCCPAAETPERISRTWLLTARPCGRLCAATSPEGIAACSKIETSTGDGWGTIAVPGPTEPVPPFGCGGG